MTCRYNVYVKFFAIDQVLINKVINITLKVDIYARNKKLRWQGKKIQKLISRIHIIDLQKYWVFGKVKYLIGFKTN